ncbi:MAG: DUF2249 domain-containing protein [Betaproteobacteria bacterium]
MTALTGKPFATEHGVTAEGRRWLEEDGIHIDVRGLSAPGPLVAILTLVESMGDATPLIVHHDRDPIMLYAELAELGWTAERIDAPPGEVRLKLERSLTP